jgi:hypothetical protein
MTCHQKSLACENRCVARYTGTNDEAVAARRRCFSGTCHHQYRNCEGFTPREPRGPAEKTGTIVRDKRSRQK